MASDDDLNPDFEEMAEELSRIATAKMAVGAVARVVAYDPTSGKAKVQPVIKGSRKGQEGFQYPVISNVPVVMPTR